MGEIMLGEMAHTRFGRKIKRFLFGNLLAQYMLSRKVPEYPGYDDMVEAPKGLMDITSLLDSTAKMSAVARTEREENFNKYLYSFLNLMMSRMGVTDEERMQLRNDLSSMSKEILRIAPGSPIHLSKNKNTNKGSNDEDDIDVDVMGPMTLVSLGADDEPGSSVGGRSKDEG